MFPPTFTVSSSNAAPNSVAGYVTSKLGAHLISGLRSLPPNYRHRITPNYRTVAASWKAMRTSELSGFPFPSRSNMTIQMRFLAGSAQL